ncbi:hypothetical protein C7B76_16825 [filamentous cyanobacterium CCP2]|nr:hypothetical protein C7B76_16825 [filamentous cyanobacterium CCP2]
MTNGKLDRNVSDSDVQDLNRDISRMLSLRDVDYNNLALLLKNHQWKEANEETLLKLLEASGRIEFLITSGRLVREDVDILFLALDAQGRLKILKALAISDRLQRANLEALFQQLDDWMSVPERLKLLALELLLALDKAEAFSEVKTKKYFELLRTDRSQEKKAVKLFLAMAVFGLITKQDIEFLQQVLDAPEQIRFAKIINLAQKLNQAEAESLVNALASDEFRLVRLLKRATPTTELLAPMGLGDINFPSDIFGSVNSNDFNPLTPLTPSDNQKFSEILDLLTALDSSTHLPKSDPNVLSSKPPSTEEYSFIKLLEIMEELRLADKLDEQDLSNLLNHFVFSDEATLQDILKTLAELDSSHRLDGSEVIKLAKAFASKRFKLPKVLKLLMEQDVFRQLKGQELESFGQSLSANGTLLMKVLEILMNVTIFLSDRLNKKFNNADNSLGSDYPIGELSNRLSKKCTELLFEAITEDRIKVTEMVKVLLKDASASQLPAADRPTLRRLLNSSAFPQASERERQAQLQSLLVGWQHRGWHLTWRDFEFFPCNDLQTINELWKDASKGRFGFSAQQEVWKYIENNSRAEQQIQVDGTFLEQFGDLLGWRTSNIWIDYNAAIKKIIDSNALRSWIEEAPQGHLPMIPLVGWWCWMGGMEAILTRLERCNIQKPNPEARGLNLPQLPSPSGQLTEYEDLSSTPVDASGDASGDKP